MKILKKGRLNGKKVAIVGAGPAGLTAAATLAKLGYKAEIYEESKKAGGYLRYGIPEYRLSDEIVDSEIKRIEDLGVLIHLGVKVDQKKLDELKTAFDAVVLALGANKGKVLPMFEKNKKTITAVDFLAEVKSKKGQVKLPEQILVIGGGDVAMVANYRALGLKKVSVARAIVRANEVDRVSVIVVEVGELINANLFVLTIAFDNGEGNVEKRSIVLQVRFISSGEEVIGRVIDREKDFLRGNS